MKKYLAILATILIMATLLGTLVACGTPDEPNNDTPPSPEPDTFVTADGIRLLDHNGNPMGLMGTNLGGWLVQEQWLCPTETGREIAQLDIYLTLYNRFGEDKAKELIGVYEDNWVTEQDFANIKNLGLNCVRIPFTYMNLMDPLVYDDSTSKWVVKDYADLTMKEDAFDRLDWALEMCEKYQLYAILDMHGAVGSQSGQDHTGDISEKVGRLWRDDEIGETCREKTKELWVTIAERYKNNVWVAVYDLMNEPGVATLNAGGGKSQTTTKQTWEYFDELIIAIREVDPNHVISVESCWSIWDLPKPSKYDWENVIYQFHHYNWASGNQLNSAYYNSQVGQLDNLSKRDYPVLIGEFNVWPDTHPDKYKHNQNSDQTEAQAWAGVMELYTGKGWSFTTWTLKHAAGYSSWGLYNFNESTLKNKQANIYTDSAETIAEIWALHNSSNYHENTDLTNCIKPYLDKFYSGEDLKPTDEQYYILDNLE